MILVPVRQAKGVRTSPEYYARLRQASLKIITDGPIQQVGRRSILQYLAKPSRSKPLSRAVVIT